MHSDNIRGHTIEQFHCLTSFSSNMPNKHPALFGEYMENMHEDMQTWLSYLLHDEYINSIKSIYHSFQSECCQDISMKDHLSEIQSDKIMSTTIKGGRNNTWKTNDTVAKCPLLFNKTHLCIIGFSTPYLVNFLIQLFLSCYQKLTIGWILRKYENFNYK